MNLSHRNRWLAVSMAAFLAAACTLIAVGLSGPASAHGSLTDPPSRNYGCWDRWGADFQNPNMVNVDPMCAQAWAADPNAMWNWNGLYREGVAGNHQAAVPDGQLCSGGRTQSPRYNALDAVGPWIAATKPNTFTLTLTDQAQHGADYLLIYITKQGFDPTTQPLTWGSLELVNQTGRYAPAPQYQAQVNAGNRTGRHVIYTVWQASHLDQSYYLCSDVIFTGGTGTPPASTPPVSTPPVSTPPVSTPPVSTPPASTPPAGQKSCTAAYTKTSEWSGGFGGSVAVTAGTSAIDGWTVTMTFANGQSVTSYWNATLTTSGSTVTASNASYNGRVNAGGSTSFGFNGSWTGTNSPPTLGCTAR
jgi:chitin-binding protein